MVKFLLIDGSYYLFYRYFAMIRWWAHARRRIELPKPIESVEFMERYEKLFISKIADIIKKLKLGHPIIIVGLDCPTKDVWRTDLFPGYKGTRLLDEGIGKCGDGGGRDVFQFSYENELFKKAGAHMVIKHPKLEADDCLALTVGNIRSICPNNDIYIITSDMDYLQLAGDHTFPIDLKYKLLTDSKNSFKNKDKDLFCKMVTGDKSDNIPGIFKRCGVKTAAKYYDDPVLFDKKLLECGNKEQYELNKTLIDFRNIPAKYVKEFNSGEYTVRHEQEN